LFTDAPQPEHGNLRIPDAPGWGVSLDRERLKETRITP
jgi:L-alanine-DL-glutamate epimerase-like enolase superfamily enzyme